MSTANTREHQTATCTYCDCEFLDGWDQDYCSEACYHRQQGADLLRNIEYDHRWCHGCFRRLKEVNKPRPSDPDFVVGYQFMTKHARHGESEGRAVVNADPDATTGQTPEGQRAPSPADRLTMTGTICECGTTDHRDAYLRQESQVSIREAAKRLCRALVWTGHEGQHDKTIDARKLARSLRESAEERGEWDWPLAVGRGIETGS